jgi:signal peptidase I
MRRWTRPLRALAGVAAASLLAALLAARFGAIYIGGRSMEPVLRPGDLVLYRRDWRAVASGDVVVMRRPGWKRCVVHRVVEIAADGSLATRGDANAYWDAERATPQVVRGVVVGILPLGRVVASVVWAVTWCYNRLPIANTRL